MSDRSRALEQKVKEQAGQLTALQEEVKSLQRQLEASALTDPLTGLRNRRYFRRYHPEEIAWIDRSCTGTKSDHRLMYLRINLDGLKEINSRFGQDAGDRVLVETCRALAGVVRASDTLFRWGGDKFLGVARSTDRDSGGILAERILEAVTSLGIRIASGRTVKIGCALGWSFYPFLPSSPRLLDWERTLTLAEQALTLGRAAGGNNWVGIAGREPARRPELAADLATGLQRLYREGAIDLSSNILIDILWMTARRAAIPGRNEYGAA